MRILPILVWLFWLFLFFPPGRSVAQSPVPLWGTGILALNLLPDTGEIIPLFNNGEQAVELTQVLTEGPFEVLQAPAQINPGGARLELIYRGSGGDHGELLLHSTDPLRPLVRVALSGLAAGAETVQFRQLSPAPDGLLTAHLDFTRTDYALALYSAQTVVPDTAVVYPFSVGGPLVPALKPLASSQTLHPRDRMERHLRQQEQRLATRIRQQGRPAGKVAAANYQVGDRRSFIFPRFFEVPEQTIQVTVVAVNNKAVAFLQDNLRPHEDNLPPDQLQVVLDQFQADFDTIVDLFGAPSDVDGDGKVAFIFTHLVDDADFGGFYSASSVLPEDSGGNGNLTDLMFISPTQSLTFYRPLLVHEFQHLINFNQHVLVHSGESEVSWLNEGLSHLSEDLVARLSEGGNDENIDAFLNNPANVNLVGDTFRGGRRGAAYLFVRSLADRLGLGVITRLVQTGRADVENVEAATGEPFEDLLAFWAAQLYASGTGQVAHPRINYRFNLLQTAAGRGLPAPAALDYRLGGPPVVSTVRPRGVNFVHLRGAGQATVEIRTDPTDPTGNIGAVIIPTPKNTPNAVHIAPDYFAGMQLDQPLPAVVRSGEEILLKGQMDDPSVTQLLFSFRPAEGDTLNFFLAVDNGLFERSIVFTHDQTGIFKLDLFAGQRGESNPFLGDFRSVQVLPGTDDVHIPRGFFSGLLLDQRIPAVVRSGEVFRLNGTVSDRNMQIIVFDFIDKSSGELMRKFVADIVDGRVEQPVVFRHDEAGIYQLQAFIGLQGQSLPFAGGINEFQVLPGSGPVQLPTDFFTGITLDNPLPTQIRTGQTVAIGGRLDDPGKTEILFRFVSASKEDTAHFFQEVFSGRFDLSIDFQPSQASPYELELFAGQLFESLFFLDEYGPINVVTDAPQPPPAGSISGRFSCPNNLRQRDAVEIPLLLDPTEASGSVGFFNATLTWDPNLLAFDGVRSGAFGPLQRDLAQVNQGRLNIHAFGSATTALELARLQWRVTGQAGQTGALNLEFTDLNTQAAASYRSLLDELELQDCGFTITAAPVIAGDIDQDGRITPRDALLALRLFLGIVTNLTASQEQIADVDGDDQVTPRDALLILQAFLGRGPLDTAGKPIDRRAYQASGPLQLAGQLTTGPSGEGHITLSIPDLPAGAVDLTISYNPDLVEGLAWVPANPTGTALSVADTSHPGFLRIVHLGATPFQTELGTLHWHRGSGAPGAIGIERALFTHANGLSAAISLEAGGRFPLLPRSFGLHANVPNPFNPETSIRFDLPSIQDGTRLDQRIRLDIYNTLGQHVRSLVDAPYHPGNHTAIWDGRDLNGRPVASGVYFYRLQTDMDTATRRLMLIR